MAYPVSSGAILEVTNEGRHNDQIVMNVFHFYMQNDGGITDGAASAAAFLAWWKGASSIWDDYLACISQDVVGIQAYAQWITPVRYRYVIAAGAPEPGGYAGPSAPQNVQASLTFFGDEANRRNLGRKALPGVPIDQTTNGKFSNLHIGLMQVLCDSLVQTFIGPEGEEYDYCIFNRQTPELSPLVVGGFPQDTVRVERRRTLRVGA